MQQSSENDFHYAFRCNSCISLSANIAVSNMNTAAYAKKHYTVNSDLLLVTVMIKRAVLVMAVALLKLHHQHQL